MKDFKKIYISGPITGHPDYLESFAAAEKLLREVFPKARIMNPATECPVMEYKDCMDYTLNMLMKADAIYMMKGWPESRGCKLENLYAITVGIDVLYGDEEEFKKWLLSN